MKLRFGDCTLDIETRRLFRGDEEVHLSPKAFELLRLLIQHRDRALSKAELLEHVWTGVSVPSKEIGPRPQCVLCSSAAMERF